MRFSSIFQLPSNQRAAVVLPVSVRVEAAPTLQAAAAPQQQLPEALDERVRLVGEWQFGEA